MIWRASVRWTLTQSIVLAWSAAEAHWEELAFVYAHELSLIWTKRHKTKRLQEQLISIDEARKMVGILVNSRNAVTDLPSLIKTVVNIKTIGALRAHQANFLRSQEVEADSCAAALLVGNRLGDPLRGFDSYTSVHGKKSEAAKIDADHPPDAERRRSLSTWQRAERASSQCHWRMFTQTCCATSMKLLSAMCSRALRRTSIARDLEGLDPVRLEAICQTLSTVVSEMPSLGPVCACSSGWPSGVVWVVTSSASIGMPCSV